jgi:hypothetical protein
MLKKCKRNGIWLVLACLCVLAAFPVTAHAAPKLKFSDTGTVDYYGFAHTSFPLWFSSESTATTFINNDIVATSSNTSKLKIIGAMPDFANGDGKEGILILNIGGSAGTVRVDLTSKHGIFAKTSIWIHIYKSVDGFSLLTTRIENNGNKAYALRGKSLKLSAWAWAGAFSPNDYLSYFPLPAKSVKWKTSNKNIATVKKGKVTIKKTAKVGKAATITARYKDPLTKETRKRTYKVYAAKKAGKVKSFKIMKNYGSWWLYVGENACTGAYTTKLSGSAMQTVKYKSANPSIATVNSVGIVTAKKIGITKVTVTCAGKKLTFTVNVVDPRTVFAGLGANAQASLRSLDELNAAHIR